MLGRPGLGYTPRRCRHRAARKAGPERGCHDLTNLIVSDYDAEHVLSHGLDKEQTPAHQADGNLIMKVLPCPTALAAVIVPLCVSTIAFVIASPRPDSSGCCWRASSARYNRSKMRGSTSGAIPA